MKRIATACLVAVAFVASTSAGPSAATPPSFTETDCEGLSDSIYRLYTAALGREAEEAGYDFWLAEYQQGRFSLVRAADFFVTSDEFRLTYGSLSNEGYVEQLYLNVLGRPGEASGVAFWTSELDSGSRDRALVLLDFSESPENVVNTETKTPSLGYFNRGLDTAWACLPQPASDSCSLSGDNAVLGPLLDFTIEVPETAGGSGARATVGIDVARNGVFEGTRNVSLSGVVAGERMRHTVHVPSLDGPGSVLTCSIRFVNAGVPEPPENPGDIDGSTCTFVGESSSFGVDYMTVAIASPSPTGGLASGNAVAELRVDGFRVAESPVSLNTPSAGAAGEGSTSFLDDLIAEGIDMRRVTCTVVAVSWN